MTAVSKNVYIDILNVCNDKCRCEWKELINNGKCDNGFIWNSSNSECECDKLCDVGEYLDYKSCKCRRRLINKLVEQCSGNIDGNELIYNSTLNYYEKICSSCTVYIILFFIAFLMIIGLSSAFFSLVHQKRYYSC